MKTLFQSKEEEDRCVKFGSIVLLGRKSADDFFLNITGLEELLKSSI